MRFIIRLAARSLFTSDQLTLTLPWVKARTGSFMAVGQTLSLLPHNKKGKGRQRETKLDWISLGNNYSVIVVRIVKRSTKICGPANYK